MKGMGWGKFYCWTSVGGENQRGRERPESVTEVKRKKGGMSQT